MDDSEHDDPPGKKKPPRRLVQEGFMAASVRRHERTTVEMIRDFAGSGFE
jgi:hypothetical protein